MLLPYWSVNKLCAICVDGRSDINYFKLEHKDILNDNLIVIQRLYIYIYIYISLSLYIETDFK